MAIVVTYIDFTSDPRFESLENLDEPLVQVYLDDAHADCPTSVWRNAARRVRAIKLLTAHRLTIASQAGVDSTQPGFVAGQLTSLSSSQGSNSVGFSDVSQVGNSGDELLLLTLYGQEFLRLKRSLMTLGFVV